MNPARSIIHGILSRVRGGVIEVQDDHGLARYGMHPLGWEPLTARITIHDERAYRRLLRASVGLGSSYMDGMWDCDDLVALIRIAARDAPRFDRVRTSIGPLARAPHLLGKGLKRNTRDGSRHNISRHYDLGNDLFATFLDETMMYSSAVYEHPDMTLAEAQYAKLDRIASKLALTPDDHLLEIGTGWGALAIHMAQTTGCRVTTTTISREQHALATRRVREAGLQDRVTVLLSDYRDLTGTYDKVVSIEMIEAVGWQYFDTYFQRLRALCADDGLVLLQAITIDGGAYEVEKRSPSFINTYIFPGGCLPSNDVVTRGAAKAGLRTVQLEDITAHYVTTLHEWRARFLAASEELAGAGYDEPFRRIWDLYLAYCEAGFAERRIQDVQVLLAAPKHRAEPQFAIPARPALRLVG
jgi:cyclopropane-fatty-acyl-phospholipid synthase